MEPVFEDLPDWRDEEAYRELLPLERAGFAWEWLRRNRVYREAASTAHPNDRPPSLGRVRDAHAAAAHWGLHAFESPDRNALAARPVWHSAVHSLVLEASAESVGPRVEDAFDLVRFATLATLVRHERGEHLLLSDGVRSLRLDLIGASLVSGPVRLHYRLTGFSGLDRSLLVLRQLLALWASGTFQTSLYPPWTKAARAILLLRTHDALTAGVSQREIAATLLSREAREDRWRIEAPTLRSRVQRLVRGARALAGDGYLSLLGL